MDFLPLEISTYSENHTSAESDLLSQISRDTHAKVMMPRMLSGHLQGRALSMISHMIKPQRILEIGTYTGYSAICLAEGLQKNGKLITIDINEELENRVLAYIEKAGFKNTIELRIGNALDLIPKLEDEFDLVFIDADKENYLKYYFKVFDKVKKNGYIIADNVLWSGKVVNPKPDKDTRAILEFNSFVHNDRRVENLLMPIRDGLMILRKLV